MNILVFGNGTLSVCRQEERICYDIADLGHQVHLICNPKSRVVDSGPVPGHENMHVYPEENYQYSRHHLSEIMSKNKIDACLGMDQSVAPFVSEFKSRFPEVYCSCIFLDYPVHVIEVQSSLSYSFEYSQRFHYWLNTAIDIDKVIFLNQYSCDLYKDRYGKDSEFVFYPVNIDFYLDKHNKAKKQDYIVGCNRITQCKGTDLIIDAIKRTEYKYKHISISGEKYESVKNQAESAMKDRVKFFPKCAEEEKMNIISKAQLLVSAVRVPYVPNLSVVEAMSVKTPAIAPDYESSRELYDDAVLYFEPNNYVDLRRKIKELYDNEELKKDLAEKGFNRYKSHFTKQAAAEKIISILEKNN